MFMFDNGSDTLFLVFMSLCCILIILWLSNEEK